MPNRIGTLPLRVVLTVPLVAVNDAPSFTAGPNQVVAAGAGAQTVQGWASGFSPGPADESGQAVLGYTVASGCARHALRLATALG